MVLLAGKQDSAVATDRNLAENSQAIQFAQSSPPREPPPGGKPRIGERPWTSTVSAAPIKPAKPHANAVALCHGSPRKSRENRGFSVDSQKISILLSARGGESCLLLWRDEQQPARHNEPLDST